jgi:hypothetical protein
VSPGEPLKLIASCFGNPTPTIEWEKDGEIITNSNATTLIIAAVGQDDEGVYNAVCRNTLGSRQSKDAIVQVNQPPRVARDPQSIDRLPGESAVFSVSVRGSPFPVITWLRNGKVIAGESSSVLVINNVSNENEGQYSVMIENEIGVAQSGTATLNVYDAPVIVADLPRRTVLNPGDSFLLSVEAIGNPPPSFIWTV